MMIKTDATQGQKCTIHYQGVTVHVDLQKIFRRINFSQELIQAMHLCLPYDIKVAIQAALTGSTGKTAAAGLRILRHTKRGSITLPPNDYRYVHQAFAFEDSPLTTLTNDSFGLFNINGEKGPQKVWVGRVGKTFTTLPFDTMPQAFLPTICLDEEGTLIHTCEGKKQSLEQGFRDHPIACDSLTIDTENCAPYTEAFDGSRPFYAKKISLPKGEESVVIYWGRLCYTILPIGEDQGSVSLMKGDVMYHGRREHVSLKTSTKRALDTIREEIDISKLAWHSSFLEITPEVEDLNAWVSTNLPTKGDCGCVALNIDHAFFIVHDTSGYISLPINPRSTTHPYILKEGRRLEYHHKGDWYAIITSSGHIVSPHIELLCREQTCLPFQKIDKGPIHRGEWQYFYGNYAFFTDQGIKYVPDDWSLLNTSSSIWNLGDDQLCYLPEGDDMVLFSSGEFVISSTLKRILA